uniref:E3 ubiquitin-protein ligase ZNRF1 n=1 Tax=Hucho hucho TaxID=62062 RepID=A0A4W5R4H7_9TELE
MQNSACFKLCVLLFVRKKDQRHLSSQHDITCPTAPNDVLSKDAGECAICLEELVQGDTIARLPCLCIYHKGCIDEWFEVNRSCPEHPSD